MNLPMMTDAQVERFVKKLDADGYSERISLVQKYEGTTRKERIEIAAEIFQGLYNPNMPDAAFPAYIEWFEEGKNGVKNREDCVPLRHHLVKAEQIIWDISKKYPRKLLLHGDLHHENILKNETGGYTVIDPKGVIGDPVFDLSRFILDEFRDDLTAKPRDVIIDFIKALGNSVGISYEVLLQCLYVETVIWLFREGLASGESLDECESLIANMKTAYKLLKGEGMLYIRRL